MHLDTSEGQAYLLLHGRRLANRSVYLVFEDDDGISDVSLQL